MTPSIKAEYRNYRYSTQLVEKPHVFLQAFPISTQHLIKLNKNKENCKSLTPVWISDLRFSLCFD